MAASSAGVTVVTPEPKGIAVRIFWTICAVVGFVVILLFVISALA